MKKKVLNISVCLLLIVSAVLTAIFFNNGTLYNTIVAINIESKPTYLPAISGNPPIIFDPQPANNSSIPYEAPYTVKWNVYISDFDSVSFDWNIKCSNGQQSAGNNEYAGRKNLTITSLEPGVYTVWVNVSEHKFYPYQTIFTTHNWFIFSVTIELPTVSFTWEPETSKINQDVEFNASKSTAPDGGEITAYEWDWDGDGDYDESTDVPIITHNWSKSGRYDITLQVWDDQDGSNTTTHTIEVRNTNPQASFEWSPASPKENQVVLFDASESTDTDGNITTYNWDWDGDDEYENSTDAPTITHIFSQAGTYSVTLQVIDDAEGTNMKTLTIQVGSTNKPPQASFTWSPETPVVNQVVVFDASESRDTDDEGDITLYEWDWDDDYVYEDFSPNPTIEHTWSQAGDYLVRLRVTDDDGATNMKTVSLTVENESGNQPPNTQNNTNTTSTKTPGFESFILICAIALALFLWRKKRLV